MHAVPAAPVWCSVGPTLWTAWEWALSCSSMITNCQFTLTFVLDLVAAFQMSDSNSVHCLCHYALPTRCRVPRYPAGPVPMDSPPSTRSLTSE